MYEETFQEHQKEQPLDNLKRTLWNENCYDCVGRKFFEEVLTFMT